MQRRVTRGSGARAPLRSNCPHRAARPFAWARRRGGGGGALLCGLGDAFCGVARRVGVVCIRRHGAGMVCRGTAPQLQDAEDGDLFRFINAAGAGRRSYHLPQNEKKNIFFMFFLRKVFCDLLWILHTFDHFDCTEARYNGALYNGALRKIFFEQIFFAKKMRKK